MLSFCEPFRWQNQCIPDILFAFIIIILSREARNLSQMAPHSPLATAQNTADGRRVFILAQFDEPTSCLPNAREYRPKRVIEPSPLTYRERFPSLMSYKFIQYYCMSATQIVTVGPALAALPSVSHSCEGRAKTNEKRRPPLRHRAPPATVSVILKLKAPTASDGQKIESEPYLRQN